MKRQILVLVLALVLPLLLATGCRRGGGNAFARATKAHAEGKYAEAIVLYTEAAKTMPDNPAVYQYRAISHSKLQHYDAAFSDMDLAFAKALAITNDPDDPRLASLLFTRGILNRAGGRLDAAIADYEKSIKLDPKAPKVKNNLAWILATCPDEAVRDPARAVTLATQEAEETEWKAAPVIDTLAAAYAATGDFASAIKWQGKALELVSNPSSIADFNARLSLYKNNTPYIEEN